METVKENPSPIESEEHSRDTGAAALQNGLFQKLMRNGTIKLISIALALVLFLYVQYTSTVTRSIQVQVIQPKLPTELIFSRNIPPFLNVKFYGKAEQMDFDVSGFQIILENPNPRPGSNLYIANLYPEPPKDVEVSYTKELQLFVDRILLRELSVIPKLKLNLPEDHELGYVSANPRTVILKGPYETLAAMSHIETEEQRLEETDDVITRRVLIQDLPDFVSFAPNQPFQVELSINILPLGKDDYRLIKDVSVHCVNEIPWIEMEIAGGDPQVDIYVSRETLRIKKDQFQAYVFCPVFFDTETKSLRPSFLIQNQPVFSTDRSGLENAQIFKIDPSVLTLQFKWLRKVPAAE